MINETKIGVVDVTEEMEIVTLEDEDGNEVDFEVVDAIELDYAEYVLLAPVDPEEGEENSAYLFRIDVDDDGEQMLVAVEDDGEFDRVEAAFQERDDEFYDDDDADEDDD